MTLLPRLAAVLLAGALLTPPAQTAPSFPLVLTGEECWASFYDAYYGVFLYDVCYAQEWVLQSDGTFDDTFGFSGTWDYDKNRGPNGALSMQYDYRWLDYLYEGARTGTCVGGAGRSRATSASSPHKLKYWTGCL